MSNQLYRNDIERYNYLEHPVQNKGDLHVGTADQMGDNLPVGVDGLVLVADSAELLGVKWGIAGGGAIPDPLKVDVIEERTPASGITMSNDVLIPAHDLVPLRILTDTINTFTPANGVIIESIKHLANKITCDNIECNTIDDKTGGGSLTVGGVILTGGICTANQVKTDSVIEKTLNAGVTIEGTLLKDNNLNTAGTFTSTNASGFSATIGQVFGNTVVGNSITSNTTVSTDSIIEKTLNNGVNIDGVLLKDNTLFTDTIKEKTPASGVSFTDEIYLPTIGGTPSPLSTYEENTTDPFTYAGGFTVNPTGAVDVVMIGNLVNVYIHPFAGTSNATTIITSTSTIATRFRPPATTTIACQVFDNNVRILGYVSVLTTGQIQIETCDMTSGQPSIFTASGQKGIQRNIIVSYTLI